MDVWEVPCSSCSGLDKGFLMDVRPTRASVVLGCHDSTSLRSKETRFRETCCAEIPVDWVADAVQPTHGERLVGLATRAGRVDLTPAVGRPRDLATLPPNDIASSPLAEELRALGAFRADVTGAGPAVYGLFHHRDAATRAESRIARQGRTWLTVPAWYV